MPSAFGHISTWVPMLVVTVMGICAFLAYGLASRAVRLAIQGNNAALDRALETALQASRKPKRPLSEQLLTPLAPILTRAAASKERRWIVQGTLTELHAAYVDSCDNALRGRGRVERMCIRIGHSLIAIALFFTFALIAWVLASDVPAAIYGVAQTGDAKAGQTGTDALQRAVGLMGAKFGVSALGLLLSLLFGWLVAARRQRMSEEVLASLGHHRAIFVTAEEHRAELFRSEFVQTREDLQQLLVARTEAVTERLDRLAGIETSVRHFEEEAGAQLRSAARVVQTDMSEARDRLQETLVAQGQAVSQRLDQLASIEVSVKDMGNEVKAHLGMLMKQHVADQICDAMAELRAFADQMAQRLESGLTESVTRLATEGLTQLGTALNAIRDTIERQTQSDVERLISQMRDMLSGGFQSESQQMTHVMASLRDVLPGLEVQLRRMTEDVDRQLRERSEDHQRLQAELIRQVESVVAASRNSQSTVEDLLGRIGRVAEDSTQELHNRLSASGEATLNRLTSAAANGLRDLQEQLGQINEMANGNVSAFGREVATAAETLAAARASLAETLNNVERIAAELRNGLAGARESLAMAEQAGTVFSTAGRSIGDATERTQQIVSSLGDRLEEEAGVIESHKALAIQLEQRVVPALERAFTGYTRAVEEQSQKLQEGWRQLAERVQQTVEACGVGLQDSVQQLVEQVDLLKRQLDRAQPGVRRS
jgi:hypothetical protein